MSINAGEKMNIPTKELIDIFQSAITSKIQKVTHVNLGIDNTNDVFQINTNTGNYIVKVLKDIYPNLSVFWRGISDLFEVSHEATYHNLQNLAEYLNKLGVVKVPKIIKTEASFHNPIKKPYVILEMMQGRPIPHESEISNEFAKSADAAYQLGELLSKTHAQQYDYFGNIAGSGQPLSKFPEKFKETLKKLASTRKASENPEIQQMLPYFLKLAEKMHVPKYAGLIMLDLWPSQFLAGINDFSAFIDIESYVIGPIELELVLVELWLGRHDKFKEAYLNKGASWPDFEEQRELYRYFLYLLYDCPELGLQACLESKALFPQGERLKSRISSPRPRPPGYPRL